MGLGFAGDGVIRALQWWYVVGRIVFVWAILQRRGMVFCCGRLMGIGALILGLGHWFGEVEPMCCGRGGGAGLLEETTAWDISRGALRSPVRRFHYRLGSKGCGGLHGGGKGRGVPVQRSQCGLGGKGGGSHLGGGRGRCRWFRSLSLCPPIGSPPRGGYKIAVVVIGRACC